MADPTKPIGIKNSLRVTDVVRQTNALADAMKRVDALRAPHINTLTATVAAIPQVGAINANALTRAASAVAQASVLRTPEINALTSAAAAATKPLDVLRLPQNSLLTAAPKVGAINIDALTKAATSAAQIGAIHAPQINALTAYAPASATEAARQAMLGHIAVTPGVSSQPAPQRRAFASTADLGRFVRERRLEMALTQQELADAAGTGRRFISELETGKSTLEIGKVIQVCRYLGLDLFVAAR